ncbi:hypothetical protein SUGI_0744290 [Cryptomeria japonica]|nr:hypothetical protein SUGI_0744290 [Cryptomeria japonica]
MDLCSISHLVYLDLIMAWALAKKVMSSVNPVSVQLMNYIKLPDHKEKLGYQEWVISDITFLKEEISQKPYCLCTVASYIWDIMTGSCIISFLSSKHNGENMTSSTPSANLRTIVFVDDLDRCQESVILQVLSAINLVLAVCEISVVLGMDKELIQWAIMKSVPKAKLENIMCPIFINKMLGFVVPISGEGSSSAEMVDAPPQTKPAGRIAIDIQDTDGTSL